MIALIDYGMGNLHSVAKALEHVGGQVEKVQNPESLAAASHVVLPGVGAFRDCMAALKQTGMDEALLEQVKAGKPLLGICLGMQVMLDRSSEFGDHAGLGLIAGTVEAFPDDFPQQGFKVPHMGWNDVVLRQNHPVLRPLAKQQVYYVHSYHCKPKFDEHIMAECSYGDRVFACAIAKQNVLGVQFHPEKSQQAGLAMLKAFLDWRC